MPHPKMPPQKVARKTMTKLIRKPRLAPVRPPHMRDSPRLHVAEDKVSWERVEHHRRGHCHHRYRQHGPLISGSAHVTDPAAAHVPDPACT